MADTSDVENELVDLVLAVVYPNGTSQPSIVNAGVKIYRGWPVSAGLDTDLAAGVANISVFPPPGMERNTSRYDRDDIELTAPVHTLTATVAGNKVTIGGSFAAATPQNVVVLCGAQLAFAYSAQADDTLASIATNLAALIAASFPGTAASGAVITIAGNPGIVQARIGGVGQIWTEQARQEKVYWITCWCPTPAMRDILAPAIDVTLKQLDFVTLADGSEARLIYHSSRTNDEGQKVQIYRRDLLYSVEYATSTTTSAPETVTVGLSESVNSGPSQTSYL